MLKALIGGTGIMLTIPATVFIMSRLKLVENPIKVTSDEAVLDEEPQL